MSADGLYPTPTRAALLREIDDGDVWEDWTGADPGEVWVHVGGRRGRRVTTRVREMEFAGWCHTESVGSDLYKRRIALTDAGRKALARDAVRRGR